jgi:hypothetical protein
MRRGLILLLLVAGVIILISESYGVTFNITITDGFHARERNATLRPISTLEGTIRGLSSVKGDVYLIDRVSAGLQRTTLSIKPKSNFSDFGDNTIAIEEYGEVAHLLPPNIKSLRLPEGEVSMGVFVIIEATSENMEWALLKVRYTRADFPADIAEESIHLARYDPDADQWIRLSEAPHLAYSSGVNTDRNYAWANITEFGIFGLMGGGMTVGEGFEEIPIEGLEVDLRSLAITAGFILVLYAFIRVLSG